MNTMQNTTKNTKSAELLEAAKPLIRWINENGHPHCTAIVTPTSVEFLEGALCARTCEFVRD